SIIWRAILVTATAGNAPQSISKENYRICPLPPCKTCPSTENLQAPGVGLALETSHGAAVVRFHDGSHKHIALIEGDTSYKALLRGLSTGPVNRTPDHIDSYWDQLQYVKSRAQRRLNKMLGRPATPESAVLGVMVAALLDATRPSLGEEYPVTAAVLSSPDRVKLTDEEIGDIFDYLRIRNLMTEPDSLEDLYATSAAYAGYGRGLCDTYTDAYACEREESQFPAQRLLHIDFNSEALGATTKSLQSARDGSVDTMFVDFDLGYAREETRPTITPDSDSEIYWAAVSARIRGLVASYKPRITELLLTGTSAKNKQFQRAVQDALLDVVPDDVLATLESFVQGAVIEHSWEAVFEFATAQGAAEIAKRRQEGPVRCAQSDECRRRREEQRTKPFLSQGPDGNIEL
ncbi:hypothetical protein HII31_07670, partial [Pseudocercospora fuligena]